MLIIVLLAITRSYPAGGQTVPGCPSQARQPTFLMIESLRLSEADQYFANSCAAQFFSQLIFVRTLDDEKFRASERKSNVV